MTTRGMRMRRCRPLDLGSAQVTQLLKAHQRTIGATSRSLEQRRGLCRPHDTEAGGGWQHHYCEFRPRQAVAKKTSTIASPAIFAMSVGRSNGSGLPSAQGDVPFYVEPWRVTAPMG